MKPNIKLIWRSLWFLRLFNWIRLRKRNLTEQTHNNNHTNPILTNKLHGGAYR